MVKPLLHEFTLKEWLKTVTDTNAHRYPIETRLTEYAHTLSEKSLAHVRTKT